MKISNIQTSFPTALRFYPLLGAILLTAVLSGCGFQLRSTVELPQQLSPIMIQGIAEQDDLKMELEKLLDAGSLHFVDKAEDAATLLKISDREKSRRVLSVDSRGRAAEYALRDSLSFSLTDAKGKLLAQQQSVTVLRSYTHSAEQVLGKQYEEAALREEMTRDLAAQILSRLKAALD